ncbi:unnamed protein product, partial [Durusdinium trenchii]
MPCNGSKDSAKAGWDASSSIRMRILFILFLEGICKKDIDIIDCTVQFEAEFASFRRASFAQLHTHDRGVPIFEQFGTPGLLSGDEVAKVKFHTKRYRDLQQKDLAEGTYEHLDLLFADATSKVLTCWSLGGRFWYLEISNVVAATLCVPSSCNNVSVKTTVAQSFLRQVAPGLSQARFGSRQDFSKATELAHWSDFPLDFVIIGVDGCGSTALHRHLRRHTQV